MLTYPNQSTNQSNPTQWITGLGCLTLSTKEAHLPQSINQSTNQSIDPTPWITTGLGCTPPPAAYFSIRSYVGFRFHPSVWFPAAELGDPANHLTLNSTGAADDPFGKTALMVSTGDAETVRMRTDGNRHACACPCPCVFMCACAVRTYGSRHARVCLCARVLCP